MNEPSPLKKKRFAPVVWGASALAAAVLVLGVTGTLSSWTTAVIGNNSNTVDSVAAVSLREDGLDSAGTPVSCDTTLTASNSYTCTTINKYSGKVLDPDSATDRTATSTVTMTNTGTEAGALTLEAGSCSSSDLVTGADSSNHPLCSQVLVEVSCTGTPATSRTSTSLLAFAADTAFAVSTLGVDESTTCTFTMTLPQDTPAAYASQRASQPLTWTLSA